MQIIPDQLPTSCTLSFPLFCMAIKHRHHCSKYPEKTVNAFIRAEPLLSWIHILSSLAKSNITVVLPVPYLCMWTTSQWSTAENDSKHTDAIADWSVKRSIKKWVWKCLIHWFFIFKYGRVLQSELKELTLCVSRRNRWLRAKWNEEIGVWKCLIPVCVIVIFTQNILAMSLLR